MINLKKSFQYQNAIRNLLNSAVNELFEEAYYRVVTEEHRRSELNKYNSTNNQYKDEVETVTNTALRHYALNLDIKKVVAMCDFLAHTHAKLSQGIAKAKQTFPVTLGDVTMDYDSAIMLVNDMRMFGRGLRDIAALRKIETDSKGVEQIFVSDETGMGSANYTVHKIVQPKGDSAIFANSKQGELKDYLDRASDAIEAAAIMVMVEDEYCPTFPVTITLQDLYQNLDKYIEA